MDETLSGPHVMEWKEAARSEYQSLMENDTWDLVELPKEREVICRKWVFKVKHDSCCKVERFSGRAVAKGYSRSMESILRKHLHLLFVLNIVGILCKQQHVCASDGCRYSVLKWRNKGRDIHATTRSSWERKASLQAQKIFV